MFSTAGVGRDSSVSIAKLDLYQKAGLFSTQFECGRESSGDVRILNSIDKISHYFVSSKLNLLIKSGGGKRPCEATATGHHGARC